VTDLERICGWFIIVRAAAYEVCTGHRSVLIDAVGFGMLSALVGFVVSFYLDLPTGACIVIISAAIFALAALYGSVRNRAN